MATFTKVQTKPHGLVILLGNHACLVGEAMELMNGSDLCGRFLYVENDLQQNSAQPTSHTVCGIIDSKKSNHPPITGAGGAPSSREILRLEKCPHIFTENQQLCTVCSHNHYLLCSRIGRIMDMTDEYSLHSITLVCESFSQFGSWATQTALEYIARTVTKTGLSSAAGWDDNAFKGGLGVGRSIICVLLQPPQAPIPLDRSRTKTTAKPSGNGTTSGAPVDSDMSVGAGGISVFYSLLATAAALDLADGVLVRSAELASDKHSSTPEVSAKYFGANRSGVMLYVHLACDLLAALFPHSSLLDQFTICDEGLVVDQMQGAVLDSASASASADTCSRWTTSGEAFSQWPIGPCSTTCSSGSVGYTGNKRMEFQSGVRDGACKLIDVRSSLYACLERKLKRQKRSTGKDGASGGGSWIRSSDTEYIPLRFMSSNLHGVHLHYLSLWPNWLECPAKPADTRIVGVAALQFATFLVNPTRSTLEDVKVQHAHQPVDTGKSWTDAIVGPLHSGLTHACPGLQWHCIAPSQPIATRRNASSGGMRSEPQSDNVSISSHGKHNSTLRDRDSIHNSRGMQKTGRHIALSKCPSHDVVAAVAFDSPYARQWVLRQCYAARDLLRVGAFQHL